MSAAQDRWRASRQQAENERLRNEVDKRLGKVFGIPEHQLSAHQLLAEDIKRMPLAEYEKFRKHLVNDKRVKRLIQEMGPSNEDVKRTAHRVSHILKEMNDSIAVPSMHRKPSNGHDRHCQKGAEAEIAYPSGARAVCLWCFARWPDRP